MLLQISKLFPRRGIKHLFKGKVYNKKPVNMDWLLIPFKSGMRYSVVITSAGGDIA